ncbi:MAG: non-canonical purine NTP pyrophosphatase [Candidatus Paceibacterota bacterium]|jgi:XTP/dITP diphosphohydrolase
MKNIIVLATRSPSKAEQIKALFKGSPFTIQTLTESGIEGEPIEDGKTLEENALKKARFAYEHANSDVWTIADDTGLFIDVLNGEPGIRSARWAGDSIPSEETMRYCLKRLENAEDRSATFVTVVAVILPNGDDYCFEGRIQGHILESPRVTPQPKMPYSSLFVPEGTDLSWAEMTVEQENSISHRGKAFREARAFLENYLKENS